MRTVSNSDLRVALHEGWSIIDLRRDLGAFNRWATSITPYIKNLVRRLAGHRVPWDLRDEIANETLTRIWSGSRGPRRSFAGWLRNQVRTAANTVLGAYGRRRRSDTSTPVLDPLIDTMDSRAEDPAETVPNRMDLLAVLNALAGDDRDLLIRVYAFGEPLASIADDLGVSKATAHRRVRAARSRARAIAGSIAA